MAAVADDDGPVGERVWADRRDDQRFDLRMNDWSPSRKRIGRRTGWSSDDQTISAVATNELFIDKKLNFDHARQGALVHNGLVQNDFGFGGVAAAQQRRDEHDAFASFGGSRECF